MGPDAARQMAASADGRYLHGCQELPDRYAAVKVLPAEVAGDAEFVGELRRKAPTVSGWFVPRIGMAA